MVVIALGFLTAIDLGRQGAYYDELHQAPAAFHYIGSNPLMFTWAYHGVPLLNMTYSGAIKSAVYGLALRYGLRRFGIISWRALGIIFVASGLLGFYAIAGKVIPIEVAILFPALLLTDVSVSLTTRHDWGPTALALGLRLVFLALWISIERDNSSDAKIGMAAFIVGLSIFEKLSSVVLVAPLLVLLFTSRRRGRTSWLAAATGLLVGVSPLIVANVSTYRHGQGLISLSDSTADKGVFTLRGLVDYTYNYLSLGQGERARTEILGEPSNSLFIRAEAVLIALALLTVLLEAYFHRHDRQVRLPAILTGTYAAVAVGLLALPRATFIHHWIIGTPFQYAAVALALSGVRKRSAAQKMLTVLVVCIVVIRIPTLIGVERSLISGPTSDGFDPAFNRLTEFASIHAADAIFIASDWGSATQLYCGSNGSDNTVFEPFWGRAPAEGVLNVASVTKKKTLYIVTTGLAPEYSAASDAITRAIATSPDWQSVRTDETLGEFHHIQIRQFVRRME